MNNNLKCDIKESLETLKTIASECIKWDKNNGLNQKAIFLCKEGKEYIYLVENKGIPFYGAYDRTGFIPLEDMNLDISQKNYTIIKETILKNINYRLDLLDKRKDLLVECSLMIISA